MRFTAAHPPCGTAVATSLPPGYPLEEGVGLFCPTCRASWWSELSDAPPARVPPEPPVAPVPPAAVPQPPAAVPQPPAAAPQPPAAVPEPTAAPTPPTVVAEPAAAPAPVVPRADAPGPAFESVVGVPARPVVSPPPAALTPRAAVAPSAVRRWGPAVGVLGVFVTLAVVVALYAVDPRPSDTAAQATTPVPTRTPAPTVTTAPPPAAVTRRVAGRRVSARLEPGWTVRRRVRGLTYAGPGGAQVRVSAGPRENRSLRRLGRDARRSLDVGGAPLRRTRVGGRPAIAVTADGQQVVAVPDGPRRWLISRPVDAGAALVASLRIRRGA